LTGEPVRLGESAPAGLALMNPEP